MFDNWINSDLIYINDILNENGEISQNLILDKLKYKNNHDALSDAKQLPISIIFNPPHFKMNYHSVSFNFVWFTIPYEFETFTFNFFFRVFFWIINEQK
jgi:hypothetical protein